MEGTWNGKLTLRFADVKAKDRDELIEKLEEMYDHDYLEYEDMEEKYNPSYKELVEWGEI